MVAINYREKPVGPLLFFLMFVAVCLIGVPLWALRQFGVPQGPFAGKLILAPILGILYLFVIARTFSFNARVRRDPRALQWDSLGLSLWQGARAETFSWPQVSEVVVKQGKKAGDLFFLKIVTSRPDGQVSRWSFPSGRLQLSGRPLCGIATEIEQARAAISPSAPLPRVDRTAAIARYNERASAAQGAVAILTSVFFVSLIGMAMYLWSSRTTLLTPRDPLLWIAAQCAFVATVGAWLLWYAKTVWKTPNGGSRAVASLLPRVMFTALSSGALAGLWAYVAANVYVTADTFGGHVEHGATLMVAEPWVSYHGHPTVHAHLINRPGRDVYFGISDADKKSMDEWYRPDVPEDRACVTVPVEWNGSAIRAELLEDEDPLPTGSVTGCS